MAGLNRGRYLLIVGFLLPIYGVGIAQAIIEINDNETPQALELFQRKPTPQILRAYERDLKKLSWFANTLRPPTQAMLYTLFGNAGEKGVLGEEGWWYFRKGVDYLIEPCRDDWDARTGIGPAVDAIVDFRDQLAGRGIELLVVPVPGKATVYPDKLAPGDYSPTTRINLNTKRLIDELRRRKVHALDVTPHYREWRNSHGAEALYLKGDTHWTPAAISFTAHDIVAPALLDLGWITSGNVDYETRTITVERVGDVVEMLQSPFVEERVAAEKIDCQQVVRAENGARYEDDPNADVLLIGDSFLRIYQGDEPGAAGFISHLAAALGKPVTSRYNNGGASTLIRQDLARRPELLAGKKVVVWEFIERDIRFGNKGWQRVDLSSN